MKLCTEPGCAAVHHARGFCNRHYSQHQSRGTLPPKETREDRFRSLVPDDGECREWLGSIDSNGYGAFFWGGKTLKAHRVSYELAKGNIPNGMEIDHICRNRACVRPEHLRAVTRKQNIENHGGARRDSKSGIRGVCWSKAAKKWVAVMQHNGQFRHLGVFETKEEAGEAARAARNAHFTHNGMDRRIPA